MIYTRKPAAATINFTVNLSPAIDADENVLTDGWTCDPGVTITANSLVGTPGNYQTTVRITGGTKNNVYKAYYLSQPTDKGQVLSETLLITITE